MSQTIFPQEDQLKALENASKIARQTFKYFWQEYSWEQKRTSPLMDLAMVKMTFPIERGGPNAPAVEHMWIFEVEFDGDSISGLLANDPQWASLKAEQPVSKRRGDLIDWMYAVEGKVYGGFTVNAKRFYMPPADRAAHDRAWKLNFCDPLKIRTVPGSPERDLSSLLDKDFDPRAGKEHPMSQETADALKEALTHMPSLARQTAPNGWSILHLEALAGNMAPIQVLLEYGADPRAKNESGDTPADLAKKAGWPQIERLLKKK